MDGVESLRGHSLNVLLEGPIALTDAAVRLIVGSGEPIAWAGLETLGRINAAGQTFILRNVESLSQDDQRRLLEWLGPVPSPLRIISTSEQPLFAHVVDGSFDATLYYRLNVILLRFRSTIAAHSPSRDGGGAACDQEAAAIAV
jgi:Sigma-54 interaction domain